MPTYEYECTNCGKVFDLFQSITEPPRRRLKKTDPRPCDCDAPVQRRIGTGGGIIFKGSGFYQTDYRSDTYKKAEKAEKDAGTTKTDKDTGDKKDTKTKKNESSKREPAACASDK
jgi:putative FmdB family regulatory protein